ncbi:DoxX family protein [Opitutaceae bacterium TAV5]|nr:DoxX family protein [Opitutaceae bacterium TAV5]
MSTDSRSDYRLAHALARLGLGVNIALHGLVRLPKLDAFASGLREQFAQSILPGPLVYLSGCGIVIGEAVIGVLLVLGLFLRPALVAGTLLMILLITGSCLIENWGAAGIQMTYLGFYAVLLATVRHDAWSLDSRRRGSSPAA